METIPDVLGDAVGVEAVQQTFLNYCGELLRDEPKLQHYCKQEVNATANSLIEDGETFWDNYSAYSWCTRHSLCPVSCCMRAPDPEQQLVQYIHDDKVQVSFVSGTNVTGAGKATVKLTDLETGKTLSGTAVASTFWEGGWRGFVYHSVIGGLEFGHRYSFRASMVDETRNISVRSSGRDFRMVPKPSPTTGVNVMMTGDWNVGSGMHLNYAMLSRHVREGAVDLAIVVGDHCYANGRVQVWDEYTRMLSNFAGSETVLYTMGVGNHEYNYHRSVPFHTRFALREGVPSPKNPWYWSFNVGNIHFSAITVEGDLGEESSLPDVGDQWIWLKNDLESVDREETPFVVVFGHRPLYCTVESSRCTKQAEDWRSRFEPLFIQYQVDLYVAGHNHNYERTKPLVEGKVDEKNGVTYIVSGTGGAGKTDSWKEPPPEWLVTRYAEYGYGILSSTSTKLKWNWYNGTSTDAEIVDSVTIKKLEK